MVKREREMHLDTIPLSLSLSVASFATSPATQGVVA